jgi:hypothetical protein
VIQTLPEAFAGHADVYGISMIRPAMRRFLTLNKSRFYSELAVHGFSAEKYEESTH